MFFKADEPAFCPDGDYSLGLIGFFDVHADGRYLELARSDMLQNVKSYSDLRDWLRGCTWAWQFLLRHSEKCGRGILCDFH